MPLDRIALQWILFAVACGVALSVYDSTSLLHPSTIQDVYFIPIPARIEISGELLHFRVSSGAWVFDLVREGSITCYFRHPPANVFPLDHEFVTIRGRIDPTPRGRLCVVEEWVGYVSSA